MNWQTLSCLIGAAMTYLSVNAYADDAKPGHQVRQTTTVTVEREGQPVKVEMDYWLYLPQKDTAESDQTLPMMLFLHGAGERGDDLDVVKKHGPPKLVAERPKFRFILISPQCPKDDRWHTDELAKLVEHVANTQHVDKKRMYVTGLSMGGSGTWSLLASYPGTFAAGIPICGRGDLATVDMLVKTPIWAVVGGKDRPELVAGNEAIVEALKKAGGTIKFTLYPDAGHDSWTETYNNPEYFTWLLSNKLP